MSVQRINPAELARPSGFSHAVVVNAGRLVFLAGQTGVDAGGQVVPGGVVAQFERALRNLLTALAAAGGQPGDLVSMTIYIVNIDLYRAHAKEIGAVWRSLAGTDYPATAAVEVSRLWDPAAVVEIQAMAAVLETAAIPRYCSVAMPWITTPAASWSATTALCPRVRASRPRHRCASPGPLSI